MFDVGILGAMSGLTPKIILDYDFGTYKGYFAENFVLQEFLSAGIEHIYTWQENRAEVEFIREIHGEIIPMEVKSGWITRAKSLDTFVKKYQSSYRIILSAHNLHIDNTGTVHRYPLYLASKVPL